MSDATATAGAAAGGIARISVIAGMLVVVVGVGGCSSADKPTQSTKMVESFQKTKLDTIDAQHQIDGTLGAMDQVRIAGAMGTANLNDAFKNYRAAVEELEKQGTTAKRRAEAMKEHVDTNIMKWQAEMDQIKDPTIKASVESRKQAVRSNYKLVRMYADDAQKAYRPFLQANKDMVQALSIDLSPASIASLKPAMDKTHADAAALKQRLSAIQLALSNIERGISPIGDAKP